MKVIVIGSGVIGVATAYFLSRRGHKVVVVDRESGPGRATSFANGSLLHPSMAEPWNAPGCWRALLGSLGRSEAPLQLHLRALPELLGWGIRFLRASNPESFECSATKNLRLARYSLHTMRLLREQTRIEYGQEFRGSLRVFRDSAAFERASAVAARKASEGVRSRRLSGKEIAELEPALSPIAGRLAGALHYEGDETGNAHRFCLALAERAQEEGVEFRFETEVSSLESSANRIVAVRTRGERLVGDRYVVAAGSYSAPLLKQVGIDIPVRPAKGYSITFDGAGDPRSLGIPVIDDDLHAAVVPIDGKLRIAGTAEFAGYDSTLRPARIRNLTRLLREVLPDVRCDPETARPWCGLRPMSADGVPIIGSTPISNLLINTGHGHLGWTLAAGSARLLTALLSGDPAPIDPVSIDPVSYALARFAMAV